MFLGYNTNGLAHHALEDACALLAENGCQGVAITLDHELLSREPNSGLWIPKIEEMRQALERYPLRSVIETGARFILDYRAKHEPNLMNPDPDKRARRQAYYQLAIRTAAALHSDCVSIWSGAAACEPPATLRLRLANELLQTLAFAREYHVRLAFEPEPGMFVGDMDEFARLLETLGTLDPNAADELGLTLDVGHLWCMNEPLGENITRYANRLINIHLDDAIRGVHEHRLPGEGEIPFPEVFDALRQIHYPYGAYIELSRHSHVAPTAVQRACEYFRGLM